MKTLIGSISLLTLGILSMPTQAAMHQDQHGNVGYDTLAECQQAVNTGTAKFYKSSTFKQPLLRNNEVAVSKGRLGDLAASYRNGICDLGTGRREGRDGVARALQGKYVPYSPDMLINQYYDASGKIVRVSMQQCDSWFSTAIPKGMPAAPQSASVAAKAAPQPRPVVKPAPQVSTAPVEVLKPVTVPQTTVVTPAAAVPIPPPVAPAPTTAVGAAVGSIPTWVPVAAAAVIGIAVAAGSGSSSGATNTN